MKRYIKYSICGAICYAIALAIFIYCTPDFSGDVISSEKADHLGSLIGGVIGSFFSFASLIILITDVTQQVLIFQIQHAAI